MPGRACPWGEGDRGEAEPRFPRGPLGLARVESRWAALGAPRPDSWGGRSFPSWQVHELGDVKLGNYWAAYNHVGFPVKCFPYYCLFFFFEKAGCLFTVQGIKY